jgi:hypothetical protein
LDKTKGHKGQAQYLSFIKTFTNQQFGTHAQLKAILFHENLPPFCP